MYDSLSTGVTDFTQGKTGRTSAHFCPAYSGERRWSGNRGGYCEQLSAKQVDLLVFIRGIVVLDVVHGKSQEGSLPSFDIADRDTGRCEKHLSLPNFLPNDARGVERPVLFLSLMDVGERWYRRSGCLFLVHLFPQQQRRDKGISQRIIPTRLEV